MPPGLHPNSEDYYDIEIDNENITAYSITGDPVSEGNIDLDDFDLTEEQIQQLEDWVISGVDPENEFYDPETREITFPEAVGNVVKLPPPQGVEGLGTHFIGSVIDSLKDKCTC